LAIGRRGLDTIYLLSRWDCPTRAKGLTEQQRRELKEFERGAMVLGQAQFARCSKRTGNKPDKDKGRE